MNFGYKTFLALTLATVACWRTKAQTTDMKNQKDSIEVVKGSRLATAKDSIVDFDELQKQQTNQIVAGVEKSDSALSEKIIQSFMGVASNAMRFIAHFENIKMNAYFDRVARKWTIGFGNTTHPNGRPIRRGDRIKDEAELKLYFTSYFSNKVAPIIAKYFPSFTELNDAQKIAVCDLCWNAGAGVFINHKEYDSVVQNMSEKQRQDVAHKIQNKNESITYNGQTWTLDDIPEWRNLDVSVRAVLQQTYPNTHIIKGNVLNLTYNEKFQILDEQQREEVHKLTSALKMVPDSSGASLAVLPFQSKWNPAQVNDSTIRYQGYVTDYTYTASDVPSYYKLKNIQQQKVGELLARANGSIVVNGHTLTSKDIPAIYFMSQDEQKVLRSSGLGDFLVRKSGDNKRKQVCSNLAMELTVSALMKDNPVAQERVATRLASFIRSRGRVVPALQKRANIRAQVFLGAIQLNGEGENSINLETANIGASYLVKESDLNNPKAICDTVKGCVSGKNFADTLNSVFSRVSKKIRTQVRSHSKTSRRMQVRTTMVRTGARGR